ncbi:MAG: hypothetical protein RSC14_05750 [Niameybacter sp.]
MVGKKLVVVFPGGNYSVEMPLLYYANFKYVVQGYEELAISYGDYSKKGRDVTEADKKKMREDVLQQVKGIDFTQYEDIVFVSKSMGTTVAGWLELTLGMKVRHIFLTPIEGTLQYITPHQSIIIVIAGTCDKFLDAYKLKQHCAEAGIPLHQIEGVGHRLEVFGDMEINIDILKEIVSLY